MITLIRNADLYSPSPQGIKDILIASGRIVAIADDLSSTHLPELQEIDAKGQLVVPGFVDGHVHLIGGGGEGSFHTRTPEVRLSALASAGITTVVGLLGTDCITRHNESLYAKTKGLTHEGVSAFMFTGGYQVPSATITGSITKDIAFIDTVIGLKTAVSDHRSSHPSNHELIRMASEARVAGMLSGKCGRVVVHMGGSPNCFAPLHDVIAHSDIPITQFIPTHVNRTKELLEQALDWCMQGGYIDITAGINPEKGATRGVKPSKILSCCIEQNIDLSKVCMSSDGNGSLPVFNEEGDIVGLGVAGFDCLLDEFKDTILKEKLPISDALRPLTSTPAQCLGLSDVKGSLEVGKDADILILNKALDIDTTIARGKTLVADGQPVCKGTFE